MNQNPLNKMKEEVNYLINRSEKATHFPAEFIKTIEYVSDAMLYVLSLIELKKEDKELN